MASRRFIQADNPIRKVSLGTANLFLVDINFIKGKGQHPRTIVREAVHIYCDAWRTGRPLQVMTSQERNEFVLAKLPGMKHTRKPAAADQKPAKLIQEHEPVPVIAMPSKKIMRTWSKEDRDRYILTGEIPRSPEVTAAAASGVNDADRVPPIPFSHSSSASNDREIPASS